MGKKKKQCRFMENYIMFIAMTACVNLESELVSYFYFYCFNATKPKEFIKEWDSQIYSI